VLNALRHRRWNQAEICAGYCVEQLCSTPCGIEDGISCNHLGIIFVSAGAQRLAASKMESDGRILTNAINSFVLNALRHRRWNQIADAIGDEFGERCSTPCGIEDGISIPSQAVLPTSPGAQRLAASKMESDYRGRCRSRKV